MSSTTLYRLSGIVLLLGGVFAAIGALLEVPSAPGTPLWIPGAWFSLGGSLLILVGWPGLYLRQADTAGRLGLLGFVLSFVSLLVLGIGFGTIDTFVSQVLAGEGSMPALLGFELFGGLLLVVGPLLLGIATLRARFFPRWVAILLIVGSIATFVTVILHNWNEVSAAILFLAIACFGFVLWSGRYGTDFVPSVQPVKETRS
jgi:hypothetical protein